MVAQSQLGVKMLLQIFHKMIFELCFL
jgi:hypothetical protein